MGNKLAIFAMGRDRPGIVAGVSEVLYELRCNIEDSSMTILKNQFAMILIVEVPENTAISEISMRLKEVARRQDLAIFVKDLENDDDKFGTLWHTHCLIKVFGEDRIGIVYKISKKLAEKGINISDMRTKLAGGKKKIYAMLIEAQLPKGIELYELNEELQKIAEELNVEIMVEELPTASM